METKPGGTGPGDASCRNRRPPGQARCSPDRRVLSASTGALEGAGQDRAAWGAAGDTSDWDQVVAGRVVRGDLDMGMIPARAWDTEGVTSLRALNAPFLVTSDNLTAQIVTGVLAPEMLAGLETVGVTGLALIPEGLRHALLLGTRPCRQRTTKAW